MLIRQIDAYADYFARDKDSGWPDDWADDFGEINSCYRDDPDRALAYVIIATSRIEDASFLAFMGCGPLEDLLREPSAAFIERIVAEARISSRFRWLLSHPYKVAVAPQAWEAIERFRVTGPHGEPPLDTMPPRYRPSK